MNSNTEKIKIGVVGCGKVAHLHGRALQNLSRARFVGAQSRSFERASSFAAEYGGKPYRTVTDLVRNGGAELVLICTPHPEHEGPAIEALEMGAHVLVEKPLALTVEECDRMIELAGRRGRLLGMISQRRLFPPVRRLRRALGEGKLGAPALGVATLLGWRDRVYYESDGWRGSWAGEGGGVLINQGSHHVDLLQWMMGPVVSVSGVTANVNHPYIEVEDTVVATLQFAGGGVGSLVLSNAQNPALYGKITISGTSGASIGVQTDGGAMFLPGRTPMSEPPKIDFWNVPGEEQNLEKWNAEDAAEFNAADPTVYYHQLQIDDFLDAIQQGRQPMVTGEEGKKSVEIIQAVYRMQQHRSRRTVAP